MRAVLIDGPGSVEVREVPAPEPADDGLVVDISTCSICATDAHAYAAGGGTLSPAVFGHEWVGTVSAVGADVRGIAVGQRVAVSVGSPCGECAMCVRGSGEMCTVVQQEARGRDQSAPGWGGFSEKLPVSARRVVVLPDTLGEEERTLLEPAAVAYRGVRRLGIELDDVVLVQGAGAIGLFAMQWARLAGAGTVIVVEPSESRSRLAESLGADVVVQPDAAADTLRDLTDGAGVDVSIECTGVAGLINTAFDYVRRGGTLGLLGYPLDASSIPIAQWLVREVTVKTSLGYDRTDMASTVHFAATGRYAATGMLGRRVGFGELTSALDDIHDGSSRDLRVVFDPTL